MLFYLGVHQPRFLAQTSVPLFVSHQRLKDRKKLPRALGPWALDSGGFTELSRKGYWSISPKDYVLSVRRYAQEIGNLQWAAIQDHMCEPFILAKTGRSLQQHQESTVQSYLDLMSLAPDLPWTPVLQGFALDDYLRCFDLYQAKGVDLRSLPLVGVGSICRRQGTTEAVLILRKLASLGLNLHGFGFKTLGLYRVSDLLASSDSMAWSFHARHSAPLPGHTHKTCANCLELALLWRGNLLNELNQRKHISELQLQLW